MGNSASKAVRKYPTRSALPKVSPQSAEPASKRLDGAALGSKLADSSRSEAIERDAADPDFLSNLNKLGQVQVDHHMRSVRPEANYTTRLFESRAKADAEVATGVQVRNKMYAFVLSELLDKRKAVRSRQELQKLAAEYNMDVAALESLGRFVNSPSINSASIRPVSGKSEEDGFMATAVWIEPKLN